MNQSMDRRPHLKVMFIEPPKDIWFVMGEYLPPPYGIIQLAASLEREIPNIQLEILDCNAEKVDWKKMEERIAASNPDVVASASLATCNTYAVVKTLETAKRMAPKALTITGGQHFTSTAQDSLQLYPEIDVIIRNEGEQTLAELVKAHQQGVGFQNILGISFRNGGNIVPKHSRYLV
jgi:anaerobic magnesium-protoporphyrin IX monomethyl ester cyclase